jgi:hypothetical protein
VESIHPCDPEHDSYSTRKSAFAENKKEGQQVSDQHPRKGSEIIRRLRYLIECGKLRGLRRRYQPHHSRQQQILANIHLSTVSPLLSHDLNCSHHASRSLLPSAQINLWGPVEKMASSESTMTEIIMSRVRTKYHWPALQLNFWIFIMLVGSATILGIFASFISVQNQLRVGVPW